MFKKPTSFVLTSLKPQLDSNSTLGVCVSRLARKHAGIRPALQFDMSEERP